MVYVSIHDQLKLDEEGPRGVPYHGHGPDDGGPTCDSGGHFHDFGLIKMHQSWSMFNPIILILSTAKQVR